MINFRGFTKSLEDKYDLKCLDEVLPKPTTRRPPSQEQVNLANRRKVTF